jgi:hypothetical protein
MLAIAAGLAALCPPAGASTVAPLNASNYSVAALCHRPAPRSASCLGLRLVAKAPQAVPGVHTLVSSAPAAGGRRASSSIEFKKPFKGSLAPGELTGAYNVAGASPPASTQTIAIVDAYNDPTAEADLEHYDQQFELSPCTKTNGCFRKVNQQGNESPLPPSNSAGNEPEAGWALEISTDIEVAHGVCPGCHILLVEASTAHFADLEAAETSAVSLGATEITNSWGGPECEGKGESCIEESQAFDHPGVVITVAAGDRGFRDWDAEEENERGSVDYPASSPFVVAVGGTRLAQTKGVWKDETVWNDGGQSKTGEREGAGASGGGCSTSFAAPSWQRSVPDWESVGCGTRRAVSDISADADPYSGVAVYDSTPVIEGSTEVKGWNVLGGTSVASPIVASIFGLAGGAGGVEYPARTLYENAAKTPASLHDVISGSNGECRQPFNGETGESGCITTEEEIANSCLGEIICVAHPGYDGPTGLGTPNGIAAFKATEVGGSGKGGGSEGTGASAGGASGTASPGSGPPVPAPSAPAPVGITRLQITRLALTIKAILALNHSRPSVSQVGFAFTLSAAARVRVTLSRRITAHHRSRWQILRGSTTIAARAGRNSRRLSGHGTLAPGLYRLTLSPARASARSILFQIG